MPPKSRSKNSRSLVEEGSSSNIPIGRQLNPHIIKCLEDELSRCGQPSSSNHYYRTLRTAITSIEEHPKKIYNGTEAKALKGIGGKTAFKIDKYLKDNNIDLGVPSLEAEDISLTNQQYIHDSDTLCGVSSSSDNNGSNSRTKQKKRKRKYMPKFKSAAWAIMISMYRLCKENNCETVTKQQIVETCGQLTDTSMDRSTNGSNYTGWSSMKTLIDHEYVFSHKKGKYCLTKYGRRVARRLHKAEKDMFDKTFTWNESEEELSSSSSTYSQEEPYIQLEIHNDQMTSNSKAKYSKKTSRNTNDSSQNTLHSFMESDPDLDMDLLPPQNSQKLVNMTPSPANSVCTSIVDHVRSDRLSTPNNNLIPSFSAPIFIIDDENDDTDSRSNIDFHSFGIKAFYVDDHLKETMTLNNAKMSMDRKSGSLCRMVRIVVSCPHNRFILEEQIFDSIPQYSTREDDTIIATGLVKESRCTENANDLLHALIVDHSSLVLYTPNHKTLHSNHESITIVQSKKNSSLTDQETLIMLDTCQSKKRKKSYDDTQDMPPPPHNTRIAALTSSSSSSSTNTTWLNAYGNQSSHHHVSPPEPLSLSVLHHDNTRTDPSEFPVTNLSLNHSLTENTVLPVIDFNHYDSKSSNNESSRLQQHSNQQRHEPRYKIHLIVDQRERTGSNDRKMFCETLCKNHVDALIHQLGVGDMIWIAKPCSENSNELLSHHEEEEQQTSHVLNFIVERKDMNDLSSSLKDGRFEEQKYRLKQTHCSNVIYLIERESNGQPPLEKAIHTLIQEGFQVKHTISLEASIQFLVQMNETIIQLIEENGIEPYKLRVPITQDELPLMVENTLSMSTMEGVGGAGAGAHTVTTTTTTTTTTATTTTAMTRRYYSNNNNNNTYPFIAKSPLDFIQYDTKMYDASTRLSPSSSGGGGGGRNEEPLSCSGGASAASVNTLIPSLCVNKDNNPIQITTTTSFESLTCNHCGTSMHERFTSSSSHTNNVQYTFNPTLEEYNTKFNKGSFHVSKKDIFARQLTSSIQRCSPQIASSIVLNYSTPSSLYNAFKRHGEDALQYIPISTDNATQVPTRKVGKALSKNIYATFMK